MNKRFLIAWLVVFIVWMAGSFLIHDTLLKPDYMQYPNLFRPEAEAGAYFPWMILAHVLLAATFVWIYSRGVEARPWIAQGARYGLCIAFLTSIPFYLIYYAVQPLSSSLVVKQIIFTTILSIVLGVIAAFFYRDVTRAV